MEVNLIYTKAITFSLSFFYIYRYKVTVSVCQFWPQYIVLSISCLLEVSFFAALLSQWSHSYSNIFADQGTVERSCWPVCSLFYSNWLVMRFWGTMIWYDWYDNACCIKYCCGRHGCLMITALYSSHVVQVPILFMALALWLSPPSCIQCKWGSANLVLGSTHWDWLVSCERGRRNTYSH